MKLPVRRPLSILLPLCAALLGGCAMTTVRQSPDFAARRRQIQSVAVMAADVKFTLITFQGDNPRLTEDETRIAPDLPGLVAAAISARGFQVRDPKLFKATLVESPDLRLSTTQVTAAFVEEAHEAYASGIQAPTSTAESYRRSLGPSAAALADRAESDALVFVQMEGFKKSSGEVALDLAKSVVIAALTGAVTVTPSEGAVLCVALVDGKTGDVLWQNVAATQVDYLMPGVVEGLVQGALASMPLEAAPPAPVVAAVPAPVAPVSYVPAQ